MTEWYWYNDDKFSIKATSTRSRVLAPFMSHLKRCHEISVWSHMVVFHFILWSSTVLQSYCAVLKWWGGWSLAYSKKTTNKNQPPALCPHKHLNRVVFMVHRCGLHKCVCSGKWRKITWPMTSSIVFLKSLFFIFLFLLLFLLHCVFMCSPCFSCDQQQRADLPGHRK